MNSDDIKKSLEETLKKEIKSLEYSIKERSGHIDDTSKTEKFRWHHRMMLDRDLKRLETVKNRLSQISS